MTRSVADWHNGLKHARADTAAKLILSQLLGYRDSSPLIDHDAEQLAFALEAWGMLVLDGAHPDGSAYVAPTSDERASAYASLVARVRR